MRQNREKLKNIGGIYCIKNITNGKILIMSDIDLSEAVNRLQFAKRTGICVYAKLQEDWKKYGGLAFEFSIIEQIKKQKDQTQKQFLDYLQEREEWWRNHCKTEVEQYV